METIGSLFLNGSLSDRDGIVVTVMGRILHLAHRKSSINANFLPPHSYIIFQNKEMKEKLGVDCDGGRGGGTVS